MSVQQDWSKVRRLEYTTADLIEIAALEGHKISAVQLAQWHRYGLLPRPRKKSLGKYNGSVSLYPAETRDWLLDLLRIHEAEGGRRLLYVAWRLWWIGRPVAMKRVRELLIRMAERFDKDRDRLAAQSAEEREAWVQRAYRQEAPADAKALTRARTRLRGDTPQLLHVIADAVTGSFNPSDEDMRVAQKASGLARMGTSKPSPVGVPLPDPALQASLSAWVEALGQPMQPLLESLGDEELIATRDEVHDLFANLQSYVRATAALHIKGDIVVTDWSPAEDVCTQATFVLIWQSVRVNAQAKAESTVDLAQAGAAVSRIANEYELVRVLRRSATFADLVSPERLSQAMADKRSHEQFQRELQARINEHRDEARALWEEAKADWQ
jgi:DNA-binding transcriptional MerR regulator